jgi:hypothetical protein
MDWKATLAEILAERRQELGERPTTDEMIALCAGELSGNERERLLERASWDPKVARELFDLIRFPDLADGEAPFGDDAGLKRRWQAMQTRLRAEGLLPGIQVAPEPSPQPRRAFARAWLLITASFAAGVALALAVGELRSHAGLGSPREAVEINLPIIELLARPDTATDVRRGGERTVVPAGTRGIVLTLAEPGVTLDSGPYDLEIRRGRTEVFRSKGLLPGEGGVFVLFLPRDRLAAGAHELLVRDRAGKTVASFRLEVELDR